MILSRRFLVLFIFGTCLVKLLILFLSSPEIRLWEDHDIAVNLVNTGAFFINWDGIDNHTFQLPVYPYLVSFIYKLFGIKPIAVVAFQVLLNGVCGLLLMEIFHFFTEQFRLPEQIKQ